MLLQTSRVSRPLNTNYDNKIRQKKTFLFSLIKLHIFIHFWLEQILYSEFHDINEKETFLTALIFWGWKISGDPHQKKQIPEITRFEFVWWLQPHFITSSAITFHVNNFSYEHKARKLKLIQQLFVRCSCSLSVARS